MKSVKRLLRDTREELAAGKGLLKQNRKRAKRAEGTIAKKNAKRAAALVEDTIESIEDHRDILAQEQAKPRNAKSASPSAWR